jgi:hypothetical protein
MCFRAGGGIITREVSMIDTTVQKPLSVSTEGKGRPYIMVPVIQLNAVKSLLDTYQIRYWVDEEAISLDGGPEVTVINLFHGADSAAIQRILNSVP